MKRIGFFLLYDTKGIIYEYVEYLLQDITKELDRLVIISNGYLREESREKLLAYTDLIIERSNIGFDAAGWQEGMLTVGFDHIAEFDEMILFNDSFFGPFYSFSTIFKDMDQRSVDFWGITRHGAVHAPAPYEDRSAYLQTYFLAFRKRMLQNSSFQTYWKELPVFTTWDELVFKHASALTKHFEDLGFSWTAYIDTSDLENVDINKNFSNHMYNTYEMVAHRKLPIIKRKTFIMSKSQHLSYGITDSLPKALEYVNKHTDYDIRLIWDYLLEKYNLEDIRDTLNLCYVLPDDFSRLDHKKTYRAAVIAHLFYDDLFEDNCALFNDLPDFVDLYITTNTEEKQQKLNDIFSRLEKKPRQIIVVNARGRDLSALLIGAKGIPQQYQYLCFIHDKKSTQKEFITVGASFRDLLLKNMISTGNYVENTLHLFEKNPQLGLLVPPNVYHGSYFASSADYWTLCFEKTCSVLERLGIDSSCLDRKKAPVSVGSAFWCRVDALKPLFDEQWTLDDFPTEPLPIDGSINHALERVFPYVAQARHYYTATVMTEDYASTNYSNYHFMLHKTLSALKNTNGVQLGSFINFYYSIMPPHGVRNDVKNLLSSIESKVQRSCPTTLLKIMRHFQRYERIPSRLMGKMRRLKRKVISWNHSGKRSSESFDEPFYTCFDDIKEVFEKNKDRSTAILNWKKPVFIRILSKQRANILAWLPWNGNEVVYEIGAGCGELTEYLSQHAERVICYEPDPKKREILQIRVEREGAVRIFGDFQKAIGSALEENVNFVVAHNLDAVYNNKAEAETAINKLKQVFPEAVFIFVVDNPEGAKYLAGARYKGLSSDETAKKIVSLPLYQKDSFDRLLKAAGFSDFLSFYCHPDACFVKYIFSDAYLPTYDMIDPFSCKWEDHYTRTASEFELIRKAIRSGSYPSAANSYLYIANTGSQEGAWNRLPIMSKFSDERAQPYQIITRINNQKANVSKVALTRFSNRHIAKLIQIAQVLQPQLAAGNFIIDDPEYHNGEAVFPFITGNSIKNLLENYYLNHEEAEFFNLFEEYGHRILLSHNNSFFSISNDFINVFGNVKIPGQHRSGTWNNIDLTFDNIIENETGWHIIDYEWTFNFPIPVKYILFRSVFSFFIKQEQRKYTGEWEKKCYTLFDIDEELYNIFIKMEQNSQDYFSQGCVVIWKLPVED